MKKVRECWRRLITIRRKDGNTKKERRERARDNDRMPLQELEQGGDLKVAATRAEHKNRLGNGRSKDAGGTIAARKKTQDARRFTACLVERTGEPNWMCYAAAADERADGR